MAGLIGQQLGNYEIVSLLGRGGMATVYRARQLNIKREVAVKVIKSDMAESSDFVRRFEREAETIASLGHPHILKLFDYGQHGDTVYLVMELLKGGSLAELIRKGPLPLETVSLVLDQISSALEYAHAREIIHRDLKPQNILLDENGNAFLTDFGIARMVTQATALTQSGVAIGTPAYMAPEQWQSRYYDARADIYALGIVLFEMLAGRLPFDGDTPARMIYLHLHESPPPMNILRPGLPPAIEGIIEKALAKHPDDRFQTAPDLAQAFKAALAGQTPIFVPAPARTKGATPPPLARSTPAQPTSIAVESTFTPTRRNRSALLGIGAVALILLLIGGSLALLSGTRATPTPTSTPFEAIIPLPTVLSPIPTLAPLPSATNASSPTSAVAVAPTIGTTVVLPTVALMPTLTLTELSNLSTHVAATIAQRATQTTLAGPTLTLTVTANEEQTINALINSSETAQAKVAFTTTPTVTPSPPPTMTNTASATSIPSARATITVAPTPTLPAASDNAPPTNTGVSTAVATVPVTVSITATMSASTIPAFTVTPSSTPTISVTSTPAAVAMASTTSAISANNADQVVEVKVLPPDAGIINAVAFSPDGALLATGDASQKIRIWDLTANRQKVTLSGHDEQVYSVAFSPDGKLLASGSLDGTVRLWDVQSGQQARILRGHTGGVRSVAFSPDGKLLASGALDNTVRLWDVGTGKETATLAGHSAGVQSVAFSPDGKLLASGSLDETVRLWDVQGGQQKSVLQGHTDRISAIAFSPDGKLLASDGWDRTVRLWDVQSGKQAALLTGHTDILLGLAFSPDGTVLASSGADKTIRLWDVQSGKEKIALQGHTSSVSSVAFNAAGTLLASSDQDKIVRLWGLIGTLAQTPPTPIPTSLTLTVIPCTVTTSSPNTVAIRVGPGSNRGLRDYMIANKPYQVVGQAQAPDGSAWWKLKTDDNSEAWVAQVDVKTSGDCEGSAVMPTPPVVIAKPKATNTPVPQSGSGNGNPGGGGGNPPPPQPTAPPGQPTYTPIPAPTSAPSCGFDSFSFSPNPVAPGGSVTGSWSTHGATSVSGAPCSSATSGSCTMPAPTTPGNYPATLTANCIGGGTVSSTAVIVVN